MLCLQKLLALNNKLKLDFINIFLKFLLIASNCCCINTHAFDTERFEKAITTHLSVHADMPICDQEALAKNIRVFMVFIMHSEALLPENSPYQDNQWISLLLDNITDVKIEENFSPLLAFIEDKIDLTEHRSNFPNQYTHYLINSFGHLSEFASKLAKNHRILELKQLVCFFEALPSGVQSGLATYIFLYHSTSQKDAEDLFRKQPNNCIYQWICKIHPFLIKENYLDVLPKISTGSKLFKELLSILKLSLSPNTDDEILGELSTVFSDDQCNQKFEKSIRKMIALNLVHNNDISDSEKFNSFLQRIARIITSEPSKQNAAYVSLNTLLKSHDSSPQKQATLEILTNYISSSDSNLTIRARNTSKYSTTLNNPIETSLHREKNLLDASSASVFKKIFRDFISINPKDFILSGHMAYSILFHSPYYNPFEDIDDHPWDFIVRAPVLPSFLNAIGLGKAHHEALLQSLQQNKPYHYLIKPESQVFQEKKWLLSLKCCQSDGKIINFVFYQAEEGSDNYKKVGYVTLLVSDEALPENQLVLSDKFSSVSIETLIQYWKNLLPIMSLETVKNIDENIQEWLAMEESRQKLTSPQRVTLNSLQATGKKRLDSSSISNTLDNHLPSDQIQNLSESLFCEYCKGLAVDAMMMECGATYCFSCCMALEIEKSQEYKCTAGFCDDKKHLLSEIRCNKAIRREVHTLLNLPGKSSNKDFDRPKKSSEQESSLRERVNHQTYQNPDWDQLAKQWYKELDEHSELFLLPLTDKYSTSTLPPIREKNKRKKETTIIKQHNLKSQDLREELSQCLKVWNDFYPFVNNIEKLNIETASTILKRLSVSINIMVSIENEMNERLRNNFPRKRSIMRAGLAAEKSPCFASDACCMYEAFAIISYQIHDFFILNCEDNKEKISEEKIRHLIQSGVLAVKTAAHHVKYAYYIKDNHKNFSKKHSVYNDLNLEELKSSPAFNLNFLYNNLFQVPAMLYQTNSAHLIKTTLREEFKKAWYDELGLLDASIFHMNISYESFPFNPKKELFRVHLLSQRFALIATFADDPEYALTLIKELMNEFDKIKPYKDIEEFNKQIHEYIKFTDEALKVVWNHFINFDWTVDMPEPIRAKIEETISTINDTTFHLSHHEKEQLVNKIEDKKRQHIQSMREKEALSHKYSEELIIQEKEEQLLSQRAIWVKNTARENKKVSTPSSCIECRKEDNETESRESEMLSNLQVKEGNSTHNKEDEIWITTWDNALLLLDNEGTDAALRLFNKAIHDSKTTHEKSILLVSKADFLIKPINHHFINISKPINRIKNNLDLFQQAVKTSKLQEDKSNSRKAIFTDANLFSSTSLELSPLLIKAIEAEKTAIDFISHNTTTSEDNRYSLSIRENLIYLDHQIKHFSEIASKIHRSHSDLHQLISYRKEWLKKIRKQKELKMLRQEYQQYEEKTRHSDLNEGNEFHSMIENIKKSQSMITEVHSRIACINDSFKYLKSRETSSNEQQKTPLVIPDSITINSDNDQHTPSTDDDNMYSAIAFGISKIEKREVTAKQVQEDLHIILTSLIALITNEENSMLFQRELEDLTGISWSEIQLIVYNQSILLNQPHNKIAILPLVSFITGNPVIIHKKDDQFEIKKEVHGRNQWNIYAPQLITLIEKQTEKYTQKRRASSHKNTYPPLILLQSGNSPQPVHFNFAICKDKNPDKTILTFDSNLEILRLFMEHKRLLSTQ